MVQIGRNVNSVVSGVVPLSGRFTHYYYQATLFVFWTRTRVATAFILQCILRLIESINHDSRYTCTFLLLGHYCQKIVHNWLFPFQFFFSFIYSRISDFFAILLQTREQICKIAQIKIRKMRASNSKMYRPEWMKFDFILHQIQIQI